VLPSAALNEWPCSEKIAAESLPGRARLSKLSRGTRR
jgi:hypothetical protein